MLDPEPNWSKRKWKSRLCSQIGLRSDPTTISGFHLQTWNSKSINPFTQNSNNTEIITPTINYSRSNPLWENGDQLSGNQEENKNRLRIGHTRLTHSFILKQEEQPQCLTCQTTCTIKHVLIECRAFVLIRKRSLLLEREWVLPKNMINWNHLIVYKQMGPCLSKMLSKKYPFRNLTLNMYINRFGH